MANSIQFFETVMGRRFFEGQLPRLIRALEVLTEESREIKRLFIAATVLPRCLEIPQSIGDPFAASVKMADQLLDALDTAKKSTKEDLMPVLKFCPNCAAPFVGPTAVVPLDDNSPHETTYDCYCATCSWSGDISPDREE